MGRPRQHAGCNKLPIITNETRLRHIALETARLSYPGSMSRKSGVVNKGTKELLEGYFEKTFPIESLLKNVDDIAKDYDCWHKDRVDEISKVIAGHLRSEKKEPASVAAKFLNTFVYQLMKHNEFRPLWGQLHLPLDRRVFSKLRSLRADSLRDVQSEFSKSPYEISYDKSLEIQEKLFDLIKEFNDQNDDSSKFHSRIELNWLWL
jgi:hypothetical protein